ncbi:RNA processing protein [Nowakowskiella sp. JEL0078]|nr:RNA processing protein [Nowakowskiella sp. JEL0078]
MLPLSLLNAAQGEPINVELKSGETYSGHLVNCDNFMNINLREVICTTADRRFWRLPEVFIRGNTIKYLGVPDNVVDKVKEDQPRRFGNDRGRGGGGQRGGQRGGRGGGGQGRGRGR